MRCSTLHGLLMSSLQLSISRSLSALGAPLAPPLLLKVPIIGALTHTIHDIKLVQPFVMQFQYK